MSLRTESGNGRYQTAGQPEPGPVEIASNHPSNARKAGWPMSDDVSKTLAGLADEQYCYLTTTGRVSGLPREIEIWFGVNGSTVYMLSGGRDDSDWVKNIQRNPTVIVRIAGNTFTGTGRAVDADSEEDAMARKLLVEKYEPVHDGSLEEWQNTALPMAIDVV